MPMKEQIGLYSPTWGDLDDLAAKIKTANDLLQNPQNTAEFHKNLDSALREVRAELKRLR